jgi:probable HAF family extracellular repeat protein
VGCQLKQYRRWQRRCIPNPLGPTGQRIRLRLPSTALRRLERLRRRDINESGEMVGTSNTASSTRAAFWSADGTTVVDLNSYLTAGSGWTLLAASDINNGGQVVGFGVLDGVPRGFVLDLLSGAIDAVPLVAGALENEAWQINASGHVIGRANDGIVGGGPIPQGGWGFYWGGPGTNPQLLPSTEQGRGIARGINHLDELAGDSAINGAPFGNGDLFASVWQPDGNGGFVVTDLTDQIPSRPEWYLRIGFGINDDLWIAGEGRKRKKGKYSWHGVLLAPSP